MEKAGKINIFSGRILEIQGLKGLTVEQGFELSDASAERWVLVSLLSLSLPLSLSFSFSFSFSLLLFSSLIVPSPALRRLFLIYFCSHQK